MDDQEEGNELDLFMHPDQYSYYQTVSFLRRMDQYATGDRETEEEFLRKRLRVNSYLSLAFPPNDVVSLKILPSPSGPPPVDKDGVLLPSFAPGERIEVTATFMGLYGSASPLPTFYTEELLDDYRNDLSAAKSFFDLVGQLFFIRYYQSLNKYRLLDRIVRQKDEAVRQQLFSLFGVGHPELLGDRQLTDGDLACSGLFSLNRRPASGLRSYLAVRFQLDYEQVTVEQCLFAWAPVPEEQRAILGRQSVTLGEDAVLGRSVPDRMGKFRVDLRELDSQTYHRFLPGRRDWDELRWAIRFYAGTALQFEVRLHLSAAEAENARAGGVYWAELGGDAFLGGVGDATAGQHAGAERDLAGCGFS